MEQGCRGCILLTLLFLLSSISQNILTESTSSAKRCSSSQFQCAQSGFCIPKKFQCDSYNDCEDKSDERNCPGSTECQSDKYFRCANSSYPACIPNSWKCDREDDCKDGSDERNCTIKTCPGNMFTCVTSKKCIKSRWRCDNIDDCDDGSDEKNCGSIKIKKKELCHSDDFKSDKFQCSDGTCILKKWFCDGMNDCIDGSDEPKDCKHHACEANEFRCLNGLCIPKKFQCDGENDCDEKTLNNGTYSSDEDPVKCADKVNCKRNEFKCPGYGKCIPLDQVCDKTFHCIGGHDEGNNCDKSKCEFECKHGCQAMPSGRGVCKCPKGLAVTRDGQNCTDVDECKQSPPVCDHKCSNTLGSYECSCMKGYILEDGGKCRFDEANDDELLFVDDKSIKKFNLKKRYQYKIISNLTRGVALDFDIRSGRVFYTDVTDHLIYSSYLNTNSKVVSKENAIVKTGLAVPDGIAVDWIAQNIYFAESSANRIDVADFSGKNRAALISIGLASPRGLALDPLLGKMFITDWGHQAKILRADMDGKNMKVIVKDRVGWPNGITLDLPSRVVYWVDAKYDYVDSVDYNGMKRRNLIKGKLYVPHPFAITIFNDYIYFTDWAKKGIVRFSKRKGYFDYKVILKNLTRVMDLQLISPGRQPDAPNPCNNTGPVKRHKCQHLCVIKSYNKSSCLCKPRFKLAPDNYSCIEVKKFLIFARSWEVRGISLDNTYAPDVMTPILGLLSAVGTDFYAKEEYIYFSDVKNDKIGRVHIGSGENSGKIDWILKTDLEKPVGVAVDWMGGNLFWTDARVNRESEIAVSKLNGSYKKVIINKGLGKPRAIVIHPKKGYLFYTDWDTPAKIGRANMDGTDLTILINGSDIAWPNGLSVDYAENKIYWADAKIDRIESINLDGTGRTVMVPKTEHSFGLAVDNDYIYWTDWLTKSINRANKKNTSEIIPIRGEYGGLMDLQIYDKALQTGSNKCVSAGCQQLCLARPNDEVVCACGQNFTLRIDNKTCAAGAKTSSKPHQCRPGYFKCDKFRCIKDQWKCDGDMDCSDGSDESVALCKNKTCKDKQFQCKSRKCIPESWKCDHDRDCVDGSDEEGCQFNNTCASKKLFQCANGKCIDITWRCDGEKDCPDGADEKNCVYQPKCAMLTQFQCSTNSSKPSKHLKKAHGPCISLTWACDGIKDCLDGSDEDPDYCHATKCLNETEYIFCGKKATCISSKYRCDNVNNCGDWSDEMGCTNLTEGKIEYGKWCNYDWSNKTKQNYTCKCEKDEFQCLTSLQCIDIRLKCDMIKDCEDYSDETNSNCSFPKCSKNEFTCHNQHCIDKSYQCDSHDDCGDNSDEIDCERGMEINMDILWKCSNSSKLISINKTCDNVDDCGDSDDEGPGCKLSECGIKNGGCLHNCHNTPRGSRCTCRPGYKLSNDSHTCVDINECESDIPPCSQLCYNTKGSFKCKCQQGYMLRTDRLSCSAGSPVPLLIFSDHKEVRQINPVTGEATSLVGNLKSAIGIDFHWEHKMLYWSDVTDDKIERMYLNGTGREEIVNRGMNSPEGLAVDWIADNIYWTDMKLDTIEAAKINGSMRSVILSDNLDAPRALGLDPGSGLMFWTDWGKKARIERANMDGGNRSTLIKENLVWPNGLTLDVHMKKVYFIDAKLDVLEMMDYDGKNRRIIAESGPIKHPFALTVFEDYVYFTDWAPESIRRINRLHGGSKHIFKNDLKKPMAIQVLHPGRQPKNQKTINYCKNSKCSHLCVLKPKGYSCKCPFGFTLRQNDNKTCESIKEVLLYARRLEIRGISLDPSDTVDKITPITGTQNAIGVDFHYKKQYIYWTDVSRDSISRIFLNGTGREDIIPSGLPAPDGIAIDWIADNMYWTDADTNRIEVSWLDGRYRKVIITTDLDQPRAIVLHPAKGIMIWTDWGKSIIERASLDGSNRVTLVKKDIGYPNGVTIDMETNRVYWCDAQLDIISSVNLDGSNQTRANVPSDSVVYPFGITTFRGNLYWTDWGKRAIMQAKVDGSDGRAIRHNYLSLMTIVVYHEERQQGTNACGRNSSLCKQLCFALSETDYKCGCATGFDLSPKDNRTCIGAKTFLLFSTTTEVRAIPLRIGSESESIVPILGLKSSYAIDYHYATGAIYVTDDSKDTIYRVQQDGSQLVPIITSGLERPQGIAVDWVAENLYWTDADTNSIEVSRLNGSHRLVLISSDIKSPRAIVVYPAKGYMYWTDWDSINPKIERAALDGTDRLVLVNTTKMAKGTKYKIGWPNGITIDYEHDTIYWVDAKLDIMVKMDLDGENCEVVLSKTSFPRLLHPYAVTVDANYIYWTDWREKSIYRVPKRNTSAPPEVMRKQLENIRDVHVYDASRQSGTSVCKDNGGCKHLCLVTKGNKKRCVCTSGELSKDGKSCDEVTDYLIFAKRHEIQFLDLNPRRKGSSPYPPIQSLQNAIGIDFDYGNKTIYYSDIYTKEIGSINVDGSDKRVLVRDLKTPDGIAYDWTTGMLYWTDAQENTVNRLTTNLVKEVLVHEKLDEPRAIALSPCDGLMYWTDWGQKPCIRRATVDGYNAKAIVEKNLGWPNGLCVDMEASKIYWADARTDRIESADLDGSYRRIIIRNVPHVFGVTLYGNYLYWTDWVTRSIMRAEKNTGHHLIMLKEKLDAQPMDIKVFTQGRQNCTRTPCYHNGGCSDVCTYTNKTRTCSCHKGAVLVDGYRCIKTPIVEECRNKTDQFVCSDGKECIHIDNICDGELDCHDESDESSVVCSRNKCHKDRFQCHTSSECILKSWQCDGEKDCADGSDERDCKTKKCRGNQFTCFNGDCIASSLRCDGKNDCADKSDELNCPSKKCHPGFFSCDKGTSCVHNSRLCDGLTDCNDKTDELDANCRIQCGNDEFLCKNKRRCVSKYWKCDGDDDCPDKSDEVNCHKNRTCPGNQHKCNDGACIDNKFLCNGEDDCYDGSDERHANCSRSSCLPTQFKCPNTPRCIPKSYQCDGDDDCGDNSDESEEVGCEKHTCHPGELMCRSKICIRSDWKCDGEDDCGDNSDEEDCPKCDKNTMFQCASGKCIPFEKQCNGIKDCYDGSDESKETCDKFKCKKGFFQCVSGLRGDHSNVVRMQCISETLLCNGVHDCKDRSDEKGCNITDCDKHQCSQGCIEKKIGYECNCTNGFHLGEDGRTCISDCELYKNHGCSQVCHPPNVTNGAHICECIKGYKLDVDRTSCKHNTKDKPYLLVANKHYLSRLSLSKIKKSYEILEDRLQRGVAVDFDWMTQSYFIVDLLPNRVLYGGLRHQRTKELDIDMPGLSDLCIDWIGRNLYFTNKLRNSIYVSTLDGKSLTRLYTEQHNRPLSIVCHPSKGYLYYTSEPDEFSNSGSVSRIGMDGSAPMKLVRENVKSPYGLTLDQITDTLYWSDMAYKRIEYIVLRNNENKRHVLKQGVGEVYALSLFEDYLYYTTWRPFTIKRIHRWRGDNLSVLKKSKDKFFGLKVMHPLLQPSIANPCKGSPCSTCVLTPVGDSKCLCPDGYYLGDDKKSCIKQLNVSHCITNQFECDGGKCFSRNIICDGVNNCVDKSDEKNCPSKKCGPDMFRCLNGNCTKKFYVCDGDRDCSDGSDELNCNNTLCHSFQFRCKNNRCVSRRQRCNGQDNCGDNSDEEGCNTTSTLCPKSTHFQCRNGKCILSAWRCDGQYDCSDKSDEDQDFCVKVPCKKGFFRCKNMRCRPLQFKCDGEDDCGDNSDEDPAVCQRACNSETQFTCANKQCIPKGWACDGAPDCADLSDEKNCKEACPGEFLCDNGNCISHRWRCDADDDCLDHSDERNCTEECKNGNFKCNQSHICINSDWLCDGQIDCTDRSDELECPKKTTECTNDQFKCNDGSCIRDDWVCDGSNDCVDSSDERPDLCKPGHNMCAKNKHFQCSSGMCIPSFKKCDGNKDCDDGSDERACLQRCKLSEMHCGNGICIPLNKFCDYYPDCPNLADERQCKKKWENKTECDSTCKTGNCIEKDSMLLCECKKGFKFNEKRECVDINECALTPPVCDQICENTLGGYKCHCQKHYSNSNSQHCKLEGPPPRLVIPTNDMMMILPAFNTKKHAASYIHIEIPAITAFDFHNEPNKAPVLIVGDAKVSNQIQVIEVFFSESPPLKRRRRDSPPPDWLLMHNLLYKIEMTSPSHISVDYLGKNIYWVDNKFGSPTIFMSSLEKGRHKRTVMTRYVKIEGFVLNVVDGVMYWCENSFRPIIYSANMKGYDIKQFVDLRLELPTGLTIDYPSSRLFWADTKKNTIESVLFNGSARITVLSRFMEPTFIHPYTIDVFDDYLYGILKNGGKLFKVKKFGGPMTIIKEYIHKTSHLRLHQTQRQLIPVKGYVNPCNRILCPQLCVVIQGNATCVCDETEPECVPVKCDAKYCNNNGVCMQSKSGGSYCSCKGDFTSASRCKERCKCLNGGTCLTDDEGSQHCECLDGFHGDSCEVTCKGVNCGTGVCIIVDKKAVCRYPTEPHHNTGPGVIVIAVPVLAFILIFVLIVVFIAWRRRASRQFAPKKLNNMEMDNPIYSSTVENGEDHVVMEYDTGFLKGSKFKYFPSKKEKKEKEKSTTSRKKFRDSQGDYTNFTNSMEHLTEDPYNEKALLVYTDDEDLSS